ncbi:MAG: hypothetical protein ACQKBV_05820 [Puniceicoccales bacterium]
MQKYAATVLALALFPSLALAHGQHDFSAGLVHWLISPNHLPAFIFAGVALAGFLWWVMKPEPEARKQRVDARSEDR